MASHEDEGRDNRPRPWDRTHHGSIVPGRGETVNERVLQQRGAPVLFGTLADRSLNVIFVNNLRRNVYEH